MARKQLIIAIDADRAGVEAAVRTDKPTFALTVPLYIAADAAPRSIAYWWTSFTSAALPSIETPTTGCKDVFPASTFEEYFVPGNPNFPQTELATDRTGEGKHPPLTTSAT